MTKRTPLDPKKAADMFSKTEIEQPQDEILKNPVKAYGVGLRVSEWQQIETIAGEMGMTKHALAAYALKDFLKRWDAGEIQTETKPSLPELD